MEFGESDIIIMSLFYLMLRDDEDGLRQVSVCVGYRQYFF
jgi:hypothetical protein